MKVFIFGASGLMGTAFEHVSNKKNIETISFGHDELDITHYERVNRILNRYRPDVVINCVAIASIDPCQKNPEQALNLHCNAVLNLAKTCNKNDAIFVQPSSHAVFDGLKESPYIEADQVKATSVYSATKYLSEIITEKYAAKYYITRFPSLYGPRRNNSKGFVDKVFEWFNDGRVLKIADDKIDSPTYSIDAADNIIKLIQDHMPNGVYHIANQGHLSYFEFVLKIKTLLKFENEVLPAKDRDFSSMCYKPLKTALKSDKNIPVMRTIDEALNDYVNSHLINNN